MARAAEDAADSLSLRRGEILDLHQEMMRLTLRIVGETLLAYDPTNAADEVGAALAYLLPLANERSSRLLDVPPVVPTRENRKFRRQLATLDSVVLRMIAERRKDPGDRGDLLSMLIEARDAETGESMDDRQLRDEAMTILLAGHETTANALTYTFLLLSRYPAALRELRAELSQVLGGRSPTLEDLPRLTLTRWTLQESMRLYPPAWIIARSANGADEIGGHEIPARSIVFVSPYVVHRHPQYWSDPEGFDPGRFAKEPQRGAYLPFGAGPRIPRRRLFLRRARFRFSACLFTLLRFLMDFFVRGMARCVAHRAARKKQERSRSSCKRPSRAATSVQCACASCPAAAAATPSGWTRARRAS